MPSLCSGATAQGLRVINSVDSCVLKSNYYLYTPFCDKISNRNFSYLVLGCIITNTSDLQKSTAIENQLPGQLFSIQIRTRGPNCFNFIIALIMPSINIV